MKWLKQIKWVFLIVGIISLQFACTTSSDTVKKPIKIQQDAEVSYSPLHIEWLFMVQAKFATLQQISPQQYHLIIRFKDMNSVIMFSNRPDQRVKEISATAYAMFLKAGVHEFRHEAPNMALVMGNYPAMAFKVMSTFKTKRTMVYTLKPMVIAPMQQGSLHGKLNIYIEQRS